MPDDAVLERELRALSAMIEWPQLEDLSTGVGSAVSHVTRLPERRRRTLAFAAATLVVVLAIVLGLSPEARRAVADLLGIGGARIDQVEELPERLPDDPALGSRMTLAEARRVARHDVLVPAELGVPGAVYTDTTPAGAAVSLVYGDDGSYSTILTSFPTHVERAYVQKIIDSGVVVERVDVGGAEGYWIEGEHAVVLGDEIFDEPRLAGDTLLWESSGITYRLETGAGLDRALEVALSLE